MWASVAQSEIAMARLRRAKHPYPFDHLIYAGAGHFVTQPYVPLLRRSSHSAADEVDYAAGGTAAADAHAAADSWPKVLEFLKRAQAS